MSDGPTATQLENMFPHLLFSLLWPGTPRPPRGCEWKLNINCTPLPAGGSNDQMCGVKGNILGDGTTTREKKPRS